VPVLPGEGDRVVADAVEVHELLALEPEVAGDRLVALAAGARAPAAQVVEREHRLVAVLPGDDHPARGALVPDLDRLGSDVLTAEASVPSVTPSFQPPPSFTSRITTGCGALRRRSAPGERRVVVTPAHPGVASLELAITCVRCSSSCASTRFL
jgi:hypothetical protein